MLSLQWIAPWTTFNLGKPSMPLEHDQVQQDQPPQPFLMLRRALPANDNRIMSCFDF